MFDLTDDFRSNERTTKDTRAAVHEPDESRMRILHVWCRRCIDFALHAITTNIVPDVVERVASIGLQYCISRQPQRSFRQISTT